MNRDKEQLSTADLARAAHADERRGPLDEVDIRGESREQMAAREGVVDRPAAERARTKASEPRQAQAAHPSLFPERDAAEFRKRWSDVQTGFVDEPRRAVQQADTLVADVMKRLADSFAAERANLEKQWDRGDNVTTEDLRVGLQRYRSFFDRLLSA